MGLKRSSMVETREERYSFPMIEYTERSMAAGDDWMRSVHLWRMSRYPSSDVTRSGSA